MSRSKGSAEREEFWRRVVDEQGRGGLTIREFCQQQAFSAASFYAWRRELRKRDAERVADGARAGDGDGVADGAGQGRLLPVAVVDGLRENETQIEIGTPGGFTLRFDRGTTPETVLRLLDVLARCPAGGAASC